jgi:signal peptidase I
MSKSHTAKCELAAEVLRSSGKLRLQVMGWSMLPNIWPGDTLLVEYVEPSKMVEGEIILFRRDRRLFAHRIVRSEAAEIVTRGDSMAAPDSPVEKDEILGRVTSIMRNGKSLQPRTRLRAHERVVAGVIQRSDFAARLLVGARGLLQA